MKKVFLKSMLLLCALIVGSNAWGTDTETINANQFFDSNANLSGDNATLNATNFTLTFAQNESTTVPAYNSTNEEFRLYKISSGKSSGATITIAAISGDVTFNEIEFNFSNLPSNYSFSSGSYSTSTNKWTGDATSSLTLTNTDFSGQLKIKSMTISYTSSGGGGAKTDTEILLDANSGETAYGTPIDVDYLITDGYNGTVAATNDNTAVATVLVTQPTEGEGTFTITPVAVGTAVITIKAPATATYNAAEDKTYTITVTAPEGGESAAPTAKFTKVTTTAAVTDGKYLIVYETEKVAFDGGLETLDAASNTISVTINTTPSPYEIGASATTCGATFAWNGQAKTLKSNSGYYIGKTASGNGINSSTTTTYTNTISFSSNNVVITASGGSVMKYNKASDQQRFRYFSSNQQAIQLYKYQGAGFVTLNDDGYATFCSEYPLDFSDYATADYSAWYVTSANTSTGEVTFSKITGSIKGGQGILIKGTPNATILLNSINSSNELSGNKLVGCLAPTFVEGTANKYVMVYDTDHTEFQKLHNGSAGINVTIPVGKAYLDLGAGVLAADRLRIVFEENNATNISNVEANEEAVKFIENGKFFIKKDGVVYDMLGTVVR